MASLPMNCFIIVFFILQCMTPESEALKKRKDDKTKRQQIAANHQQRSPFMSKQHPAFIKEPRAPHVTPVRNVKQFDRQQLSAHKNGVSTNQLQDTNIQNKKKGFQHLLGERLAQKTFHDSTESALPGDKRILAAAAANPAVQEAVVEKGIEVVGAQIDKQLQIIDGAQNKSEAFLNRKIKLDIFPEKGWENEDMFVPPGYHIAAEVDEQSQASSSEEGNVTPYTFPAGVGNVMMNGCWGTGYVPGDPCYRALGTTQMCKNMIDGAAFIGVGFDGRGEYSPESRKMSIIQRTCAARQFYDNYQVPDTMNVHGIYETTANMKVFQSRAEYQKFLQTEAGMSGSLFGFYGGVKAAFGTSSSGATQTNLAVFDIDIDRYEIFKDEVKPQDLSRSFLREFMSLPTSYFSPGAPAKFQDFINRWGTNYIKSAKFGGQLELRKLQQGSMTTSKTEFAEECEVEFKTLFASAGASQSLRTGAESRSQQTFMSTSVAALGGNQRIAAIVSDLYSPTFKGAFLDWLDSIPAYPKAFKFLMGSISDLVDFRAHDLFPTENVNWGCEGNSERLIRDEATDKSYYNVTTNGTVKRVDCEFGSREELEEKLKRKRVSLKTAIEVYMEEGPISISDVSLPAGVGGCETWNSEYQHTVTRPTWAKMIEEDKGFLIVFEMLRDLQGNIPIPKSMSRIVKRSRGNWITAGIDGEFPLYNGFNNGGSGTTANNKISVFGLVLTFFPNQGTFKLMTADFNESLEFFPNMSVELKDKTLARIDVNPKTAFTQMAANSVGHSPCNLKWSNSFRFDPSDREGKCIHFTAFSKGTVYVVFSAIPSDKETWYYVQITTFGVAIYKAEIVRTTTINSNAFALGDIALFQSYFVCVSESEVSTVIEYGKTNGESESGDVFLTFIDDTEPTHVRFYAFGNGEEQMQVIDSHILSRSRTTMQCKGDMISNPENDLCVHRLCHEACESTAGCRRSNGSIPLATDCNACRYARRGETCILECGNGQVPNEQKICVASYDLRFKNATRRTDSLIPVPSSLQQFTICLWIKFPAQFTLGNEYSIFSYISENRIELVVRYYRNGVAALGFRIQDHFRGPFITRFTEARVLATNQWYLACFARESISGETNVYLNGVKSLYQSTNLYLQPGKTITMHGTFHFAGLTFYHESIDTPSLNYEIFPGKISHMNVWDHILSNEEIVRKTTRSCGDDPGNFLDWFDFKRGLTTLGNFIVDSPSQCRSNALLENGQ